MATNGNMLVESTSTTDELIYIQGTFTPTVTLVGGAGNTVPVYSTNQGRYTRVGNRVFVEVNLAGDGGAEGAGSGTVNVALPITASASVSQIMGTGVATNSGTDYILRAYITGSATTIIVNYFNAAAHSIVAFTGDEQNNTTRQIVLTFAYEV